MIKVKDTTIRTIEIRRKENVEKNKRSLCIHEATYNDEVKKILHASKKYIYRVIVVPKVEIKGSMKKLREKSIVRVGDGLQEFVVTGAVYVSVNLRTLLVVYRHTIRIGMF